MPIVQTFTPIAPQILAVSDDGEVEVQLSSGDKRVLQIRIEQVDQLRRVAFTQHRAATRLQWTRETT
jgi:hypothetical protein